MNKLLCLLVGATLSACVTDDALATVERPISDPFGPPRQAAMLQLSLNDPQIVQVVASSMLSAVQVAEAASPGLTRSDVEAYAERVTAQGRGCNAELDRVRDTTPLAAEWSALSQSLERDTGAQVARLATSGDVDGTFLAAAIESQTELLALVDCVLEVEAREPALLAFLRGDLRPRVATNLVRARWFVGPAERLAAGDCSRLCTPYNAGGPLRDPVRHRVCLPDAPSDGTGGTSTSR